MRSWATAAVLVAGCGAVGSPADYAEARARAECEQIERCSLGLYEATYSSEEDCLSERADAVEAESDGYEQLDCTFLPDEAGACVRRIGGLSCEDWVSGRAGSACDLVWACEDAVGYTMPYSREGR